MSDTFQYEGVTYTDLELEYVEDDEVFFILYKDLDDPEDKGTDVCVEMDDMATAPNAMTDAFNFWSEDAAMDAYAERCTRRAEDGYAQ